MTGDTRITVWVKTPYLSHSRARALISRHLEEQNCALVVCQGRAIYPAEDAGEKRKRRRRRRRAGMLLGMLWAHDQPTACQHFDRCMMDSRGTDGEERVLLYAQYITLKSLSLLCVALKL